MLEASLEDLQGRFNLNNLVQPDGTPDPVMVTAFTQLLALVGLEPKWTGYIVDWIDWTARPSIPDGAEDSVYMGQTLPYRTANRYITSASELLALPGFGRDRYLKLAPYVTALPPTAPRSTSAPRPGSVLDAFLPARASTAPTRRIWPRTASRPAGASRRSPTTRRPSTRRSGRAPGTPQAAPGTAANPPNPLGGGHRAGAQPAAGLRRPSSGRPRATSA